MSEGSCSWPARWISGNLPTQHDVALRHPAASDVSWRDDPAAASPLVGPPRSGWRQVRVVAEQDVVDVVERAAWLDDVQMDVLRHGGARIAAGAHGQERVPALRITCGPGAQAPVSPDARVAVRALARVDSALVRLVRINDHTAAGMSGGIEDSSSQAQSLAGLPFRRQLSRGRWMGRQPNERHLAILARQTDDGRGRNRWRAAKEQPQCHCPIESEGGEEGRVRKTWHGNLWRDVFGKSTLPTTSLTRPRLLTLRFLQPSNSHDRPDNEAMKAVLDPTDIAVYVQDARRGSQTAFAWLHRTFAPLVYAIHLGMTSRARAEELTQETFVIAFGRLDQLRDAASFGPWIAMIARRNRPHGDVDERDLAEVDEPVWTGTGPESVAQADEALRAIRQLPEAYRETLILRLVEGLSGPEIANLTGLTPSSVRVNLHRGMTQLRQVLGIAAEQGEG